MELKERLIKAGRSKCRSLRRSSAHIGMGRLLAVKFAVVSLAFVIPVSSFAQNNCADAFLGHSKKLLRTQTISVNGNLTSTQQRELTQMLAMLDIRRPKILRVIEKAKAMVGLKSNDLVPVIPAGKATSAANDEARLLLQDFNSKAKSDESIKVAVDRLMSNLFDIYLRSNYRPLSEPWFAMDGKAKSLVEFANEQNFVQPEISASNTWMNVATLTPDLVQNLTHRGLTRDLWWNRQNGINPLGTVRVAKNILTLPDGTQKTMSVEVLKRSDNGIFVPYYFEADEDGNLKPPPNNRRSIKKMESCFSCHLRLSGIYFGGITMKGYKAVDNWHINAIDFTKRKYYQKFDAFRK